MYRLEIGLYHVGGGGDLRLGFNMLFVIHPCPAILFWKFESQGSFWMLLACRYAVVFLAVWGRALPYS